jgi:hypothetical protein
MITKSLGAGKTLTNERIVAASEDTSEDVAAAIASATPGTGHADPQTRRFLRIADGTGEEGHQVRSLSAGVLLENGSMAALNCYADRAQFGQDAIEFGGKGRGVFKARRFVANPTLARNANPTR